MKLFLSLLLCVLFLPACKQDKSIPTSDQEPSTKKIIPQEQKVSDTIEPAIFKTSTGKSLQLFTDHKSSSLNDLKIIALDFPNSKDTFNITDSDPLEHTWIKDLDENGYDELYLVTTSSGSGSYSTIYGFASNQDLSMTPINVHEISQKDLLPEGAYYGYMGHDSIYIKNNRIYRKYPVYKEGDANCCPSGGDKTLSYYLKAGEASWILAIEN